MASDTLVVLERRRLLLTFANNDSYPPLPTTAPTTLFPLSAREQTICSRTWEAAKLSMGTLQGLKPPTADSCLTVHLAKHPLHPKFTVTVAPSTESSELKIVVVEQSRTREVSDNRISFGAFTDIFYLLVVSSVPDSSLPASVTFLKLKVHPVLPRVSLDYIRLRILWRRALLSESQRDHRLYSEAVLCATSPVRHLPDDAMATLLSCQRFTESAFF